MLDCCPVCKAKMEDGLTTSVTDLGNYLFIVRNVPCYKCLKCGKTLYSEDVEQNLKTMIESAKRLKVEIGIIDYAKAITMI